jgi:hypothetical protein
MRRISVSLRQRLAAYKIHGLVTLFRELLMALFRIAAAAGLLAALAPEQTLQAARAVLGMAEEAKASQMPSAEAAQAYCKAHPQICAEAARQAASQTLMRAKP